MPAPFESQEEKKYPSVMTFSSARIINYMSAISVEIMSVLLPHANTQSPDETECNWSLR